MDVTDLSLRELCTRAQFSSASQGVVEKRCQEVWNRIKPSLEIYAWSAPLLPRTESDGNPTHYTHLIVKMANALLDIGFNIMEQIPKEETLKETFQQVNPTIQGLIHLYPSLRFEDDPESFPGTPLEQAQAIHKWINDNKAHLSHEQLKLISHLGSVFQKEYEEMCTILYNEVEDQLAHYPWYVAQEGSAIQKIQHLVELLYEYGFDISELPFDASSLSSFLSRADTALKNFGDSIEGVLTLYESIYDEEEDPSSFEEGTPLERARQIRHYLDTHPDICERIEEINLNYPTRVLQTFPFELHQFPNLKRLRLIDHDLTALPPDLSTLFPQLEVLSLHGNELTTFPYEGCFPELTSLLLGDNPLKSLPNLNCPKLRELWLPDTELESVPLFEKCTALTFLSLKGNPALGGIAPDYFAHLNLTTLELPDQDGRDVDD